jgi:hypothetical protein
MLMIFDRRKFLQTTGILTASSLLAFDKLPSGSNISVEVDFRKDIGKIKKLHGVNGGPKSYGNESAPLEQYYAEAGFPYARLHDVNWPHADAIDVHTIFPFFDADPDNPANYYFDKSDDYLEPLISNDTKIIYRLGESIEHRTQYFIHPPKDYAKWVKICINIIRHYNDGWNKGFHYGIEYWEIWNEPEGKNMWLGTDRQYFELYEAAVQAIKKYDPELKVGGPAATGHRTWVKPFLTYCREKSLPLDFFSWHQYTDDPEVFVHDAEYIRKLLDEYGFTAAESFLDEWNSSLKGVFPSTEKDLQEYFSVEKVVTDKFGPMGAAFAASTLALLQNAPIDVANYFSADYNPLGMFNIYGVPSKVFFAFKAFNLLAQCPVRVTCNPVSNDHSTHFLASRSEDGHSGSLLVSNYSPASKKCNISFPGLENPKKVNIAVFQVDAAHNLELSNSWNWSDTRSVLKLNLNPYSVCLIKTSGI